MTSSSTSLLLGNNSSSSNNSSNVSVSMASGMSSVSSGDGGAAAATSGGDNPKLSEYDDVPGENETLTPLRKPSSVAKVPAALPGKSACFLLTISWCQVL